MVKKMLLGAALLGLVFPLNSCRVEQEQIGVCTGEEDGEIYSLYLLNFMYGLAELHVDGRRVGRVSNYNEVAHAPGFQDFGTFPQCDDATYTFTGNSTYYYEEITWTPEALATWPDGCALEIWLLNDEFDNFVPDDWIDFGQIVPVEYANVSDVERCPAPNCVLRIDGELIDCEEEYEEGEVPPDILDPESKESVDKYSLKRHPSREGVLLLTVHEDVNQTLAL